MQNIFVSLKSPDLPDGKRPAPAAPMREEVVLKWSGAALVCLRLLTVFSELPGSTGSKSSGSIKARQAGSCAVTLSMLPGAELV